ncbi:MAG: hypothetical protein GQ559_04025, partial [Desulfobulbaceae bacterium]|nr:hypothetical protein [Desulfobulbaceae bacterium]
LPVVAAVVTVLLVTIVMYRLHKSGRSVRILWVCAAIICCLVALLIPDVRFPVKRVHVSQYITLAILVRFVLSHRMQGRSLTWFTFLVTFMFGIHDEMLQGMHPLRTFGLRDIAVNGFAGLSGTLFGLAADFFPLKNSGADNRLKLPEKSFLPVILLFIFAIIPAIAALLYPLIFYRKELIPWWTVEPLLAVLLAAALLEPRRQRLGTSFHGVQVLYWQALLLVVYPVLVNVAFIEFN